MGRGRIEIRKIENLNSRQVTFSKRRSGLLKKAHELSVLCDAEIAVIIFSNTGKLFEFSSSCMKRILSRYNRGLESSEMPSIENMAEIQDTKEVELLKEEITRLKTKQARLLGKELSGCNLKDLQHLEQQLNEGLLSVKEKKALTELNTFQEQILMEQLEQSRIQEQRIVLENEALRRLVEELQGSFPLTERSMPSYLEYYPVERKSSAIKEEAASPALHGIIDDDEDSDTTLQLGLPSNGCRKRKAPEAEAASENSASQVGVV